MISLPYLLVLNIPLHWYDGGYWADPLWKKDLEAHLTEISNLSIVCPVIKHSPPPRLARLVSDITVHPLPPMGRLSWLLAPYFLALLWRAIGNAAIVHTGVAGWPFPLGWLAIPVARLRHRKLVLVIESAFWRIAPGEKRSWLGRSHALVWEWLNIRAVAACDVTFFTTRAYLETLGAGQHAAAHVLPAVWIDEEQLIEEDRLERLAPVRRGRLLFAGRLTAAKGVELLIEAVQTSGIAVDIVGEGDLRDAVLAAAERHPHEIRLLDPVGYGPEFTALLDGYAALVVPTVTDEQPRVIFDAFSRGVAVVASATTGNRQLVEHDRNGIIFAAGDADALAEALTRAHAHPGRIAAMGIAARAEMVGRTHAEMHRERAELIKAALRAH